jgi:hypothetical protein
VCDLPAACGDVAGAIGAARAIERIERVGEAEAIAAFRLRERAGCGLMIAECAEALRLPAVRARVFLDSELLGLRNVIRAGPGMGRHRCVQQDEDGDPAFGGGYQWSILCLELE